MSASEGTALEFALRDAQVTAFAIVGVAMEVGIEPTVRRGADLGPIPVVITDRAAPGTTLPQSARSTRSRPPATPS
jgi:nicotinamidase-related amidase